MKPWHSSWPGGFADRVANALLRLVEAVAEVELIPAVGGGYGTHGSISTVMSANPTKSLSLVKKEVHPNSIAAAK
jgi:hypothetical protein